MRFTNAPPQLLFLLLTLSQSTPISAGPFPKDDLHDLGFSYLMDRSCASYCGADNQYCCTTGQACQTSSENVAYCADSTGSGGGSYAVYTTTYTETDLVVATKTYSSYYAVTTGSGGVAAICNTNDGETSCGSICCASDQMCEYSGQCTARTSKWTYTATSGTYSAPLRPTSGAGTSTAVVGATTTQPFIPPATASGSTLPITSTASSNLSGGAIAGIVIGTILAVILLLLLCFCCIARGLWHSFVALFGGGRRREGGTRTERIETVERYSRHGSTIGGAAGVAGARRQQGRWFGGRNEKPTTVVETRKKKSSGLGGAGAVGAGLVGLAAMLGLKRKEERRDEKRRPGPATTVTDVSYTSYTDSYTGTSDSRF